MEVFTGDEILFFCLGVVSILLVYALIRLQRRYTFTWYSWVLSILGAFLLVFTIGWVASSTLEGEPQAASMGLLVFGLPFLIIFGITSRLIARSTRQQA